MCCIDFKRFVSHKKYFDVVQKLNLVSINVINFFQNGVSYVAAAIGLIV